MIYKNRQELEEIITSNQEEQKKKEVAPQTVLLGNYNYDDIPTVKVQFLCLGYCEY